MTAYFQGEDEYHYPLDRIVRFRMLWDNADDPSLSVDVEGVSQPVLVKGRGVDLILRSSNHAIPAEDGTLYVAIVEHDGRNSVWFQPVIAWLVQLDREPLPVTIHGIEGGVTNRYVIRTTNGAIADWGSADYPDLASCLRESGFTPDEIDTALVAEKAAIKRRIIS